MNINKGNKLEFSFFKNILLSWGLTFLVINLSFISYLYTRKMAVIDLFWGPFHFVQVLSCLLIFGIFPTNKASIFYCLVIFLWAARLTIYLSVRSRGKGEDVRYLNLSKSWKGRLSTNVLFRVFYGQYAILLLTSLTLSLTMAKPALLLQHSLSKFGIFVAIFGLIFESIADYQLQRFKRSINGSKNNLMRKGLWSLCRHPNYFGEICFWWGVWLMAWGTQYYIIGLVSPIVITYLLTRFSGVPMLEKRYEGVPEYLDYIRKTNAIIPWKKAQ